MIMFSKSVSCEYTKFLFCLTVFLSLTCECSAENAPNETGKIVSGKVVSVKSVPETSKNTEKAVSPKQETASAKKVEVVVPEQSNSKDQKGNTSQDKNVISEFLESISQKPFKDLPGYWKELIDFDVTITNTEVNDEFPSEKFSLKSLKGNVVILFFTTTWCPNCIKVFQDLDKLSRALSSKNISNVKIIPLVLGMEEDEVIKKYYEENKVVSLHRFKSLSPLFFNVIKAVPTCFVFNKKSVPVWGFSGATNYGAFEFLNFIESLSKED